MDRARLAGIARTHGVDLIAQFGSSVTGALHAHSDLDLALRFVRAPASSLDAIDLTTELQALRLYAFRRYQDPRRFLQMEREYVERAIAAAHR